MRAVRLISTTTFNLNRTTGTWNLPGGNAAQLGKLVRSYSNSGEGGKKGNEVENRLSEEENKGVEKKPLVEPTVNLKKTETSTEEKKEVEKEPLVEATENLNKTETFTSDLFIHSSLEQVTPSTSTSTSTFDSSPHHKLHRLLREEAKLNEKPLSRAYFTSDSDYFDLITALDLCISKYTDHVPLYSVKPQYGDFKAKSERYVNWLPRNQMSQHVSIDLNASNYKCILMRLDQLAGDSIADLKRLPYDLQNYIKTFSTSGSFDKEVEQVASLDSEGRAYGVGKRKEAAARAWVVEGEGHVMVNGRPIGEYFTRVQDLKSALYPFGLTSTFGKYNAWILARGGGTSGQSQAITLALSKALVIHDHSLKLILEEAGCLTRDIRRVERKKTGQPKARKKNTWVKR